MIAGITFFLYCSLVLQANSEHPIAKAIVEHHTSSPLLPSLSLEELSTHSGTTTTVGNSTSDTRRSGSESGLDASANVDSRRSLDSTTAPSSTQAAGAPGLLATTGFEAMTGLGVRGTVGGHRMAIGNLRLMESEGAANTYTYTQGTDDHTTSTSLTRTSLSSQAQGAAGGGGGGLGGARAHAALAFLRRAEAGAKTAVLVSIDGELSGAIEVSDPVKVEARPVVEYLSRMGIRSLLVTGDSWGIARSVAAAVGIPEANVVAEVLPAGKAEKVRSIQVRTSSPLFFGPSLSFLV